MKIFSNIIAQDFHLICNGNQWHLVTNDNGNLVYLCEFNIQEYINQFDIKLGKVDDMQDYYQHHYDFAVMKLRDELLEFPAKHLKYYNRLLAKLSLANSAQLSFYLYDKIVLQVRGKS